MTTRAWVNQALRKTTGYQLVRAEWVDPGRMTAESTSALLHPLLGLAAGDADAPSHPVMFRAEHRKDASGRWRPYIL